MKKLVPNFVSKIIVALPLVLAACSQVEDETSFEQPTSPIWLGSPNDVALGIESYSSPSNFTTVDLPIQFEKIPAYGTQVELMGVMNGVHYWYGVDSFGKLSFTIMDVGLEQTTQTGNVGALAPGESVTLRVEERNGTMVGSILWRGNWYVAAAFNLRARDQKARDFTWVYFTSGWSETDTCGTNVNGVTHAAHPSFDGVPATPQGEMMLACGSVSVHGWGGITAVDNATASFL